MLTSWLANRYRRPALPTAFNNRLKAEKKAFEKFKKLIESHHDLLRTILLQIDPFDEVESSAHSYRMRLVLVARSELIEGGRDALDQLVADLSRILGKIPRIELDGNVTWAADNRVSLRQLDDYVPWEDLDYLSVRDGDEQETR